MIVVFQCYGGTHTSVVAASIYTGLLPRGRKPSAAELTALPYFDRLGRSRMGILHYIGADREGNQVFALGSGNWSGEIRCLVASFIFLNGSPPPPVAVIDCMRDILPLTRVGGFISRRLGLARVGRPLVSYGIRKGYDLLLRRVASFESDPASFLLKSEA